MRPAHLAPRRRRKPARLEAGQQVKPEGHGDALKRPCSIMSLAPCPVSSAGWKIRRTEPAKASRQAIRISAAPTSMAAWASCPQACIMPGTCEAKGSPVLSPMLRASMSARRATRGPGAAPSICAIGRSVGSACRGCQVCPSRPPGGVWFQIPACWAQGFGAVRGALPPFSDKTLCANALIWFMAPPLTDDFYFLVRRSPHLPEAAGSCPLFPAKTACSLSIQGAFDGHAAPWAACPLPIEGSIS